MLRRLREAGAVILGKTHMHELAFGASGYNHAYPGPQARARAMPMTPAASPAARLGQRRGSGRASGARRAGHGYRRLGAPAGRAQRRGRLPVPAWAAMTAPASRRSRIPATRRDRWRPAWKTSRCWTRSWRARASRRRRCPPPACGWACRRVSGPGWNRKWNASRGPRWTSCAAPAWNSSRWRRRDWPRPTRPSACRSACTRRRPI